MDKENKRYQGEDSKKKSKTVYSNKSRNGQAVAHLGRALGLKPP